MRRGSATPWGEQVEGLHAVAELLRAERRHVHQVAVAEGAAGVERLVQLARQKGVPVQRLDRRRLSSLALTDSPQGVVARAEPLPVAGLAELAGEPSAFLVVLDGVTDPQNLGAIMRSALSAGATGLVIGRSRSAGLTPAAMKAAAGAAEHLRVASVAGIPATLSTLADKGLWTVALDPRAPASLWDLEVATLPLALVLGGEGPGLGRLAASRCDLAVRIPLSGPLASLNVSVAAALACFEVARRRTR